MEKSYAYVLAGGGARGAYQAGVLSNLISTGFPPDAIYGTSVGALNGACVAYRDIDYMLKMWKKIRSRSDVFSWAWPGSGGAFSPAPLQKMIATAIADEIPVVPITATFVDSWTGETCYGSSRDYGPREMAHYVLASASLPGVVPPVDGRYYDGGLTENIPLAKAVADGYTDIVVVLCSNRKMPQVKCIEKPQAIHGPIRALDIMFNNNAKEDLRVTKLINGYADLPNTSFRRVNVTVIEPPLSYQYGTLDFKPEPIFDGIELGKNWRSHNVDTLP